MMNFSIGVMLDSFRKPFDEALERAVAVGASGIQIYTTSGSMSPESLSKEKRRELLHRIKAKGLAVSALCGDFGHGFGDESKNPELIERSKKVLDLAVDFETDVVTTHIGVIPCDPGNKRYSVMQRACEELAKYADERTARFAVETGPETAKVLKTFLDGLGTAGVAVNMDPANLVMVTGDDPVKAVYTLRDYIVHTHAKDGIKLCDKPPEVVYNIVEDNTGLGQAFKEVPLGKGEVDFPKYLEALADIGYDGYLTIEREVGEDPEKDIREAVLFLEKQITIGRD